jgi:uncharacterized protein YbgA (DUF1722 family)/uncharacterized protein YbbK (DUF523 family)
MRIGISRCLLGDRVRYDGQHKYDAFLVETLGAYVEYVPVCPEVECGLPVPREAMRLVGDPDAPRLMTQRTREDKTEQMMSWARRRVVELEGEALCGFIFKSRSPSSGMERVKVYNENGDPAGRAPGMFARCFMEHFPLLPVEEDGRLCDAVLRENFIERIFTLSRYRASVADARSAKALTDFHARHKFLLMAHSPAHTRAMGRLLAEGKRAGVAALRPAYEAQLLDALRLKTTLRKHVNVMQHMLGFFKNAVSADEKQEMLEVLDAYRRALVPLIVPVTLLQHYVRKYAVSYLQDQVYLHPHPLELKLRNHA